MPDLRDNYSRFGVGFEWSPNFAPEVALLKTSGAGFVRLRFSFTTSSEQEALVDLLTQEGIGILGLIQDPAAPRPDEESSFWRDLASLIQRYKYRVRHWEFWHEPDDERYWIPQDEMQTYTRLLRQAFNVLKAEDSSAVVHLGGLGKGLPKSLRQIYRQGGKGFFDVVHIHPLINPLMPDALGGLRYLHDIVLKTMEQEADARKPIWYSHIGCPGLADPKCVPDWALGKNPTETMQASWIKTVYEQVLTWPGVERIFWAAFRDTPEHHRNGADFMGLLRADLTAKPSLVTFQQLSD